MYHASMLQWYLDVLSECLILGYSSRLAALPTSTDPMSCALVTLHVFPYGPASVG
jgi:hypothetical protein